MSVDRFRNLLGKHKKEQEDLAAKAKADSLEKQQYVEEMIKELRLQTRRATSVLEKEVVPLMEMIKKEIPQGKVEIHCWGFEYGSWESHISGMEIVGLANAEIRWNSKYHSKTSDFSDSDGYEDFNYIVVKAICSKAQTSLDVHGLKLDFSVPDDEAKKLLQDQMLEVLRNREKRHHIYNPYEGWGTDP